MRFFANHRCRTVFVCGTLLVLGAASTDLRTQDAQAQGTIRSEIAIFDSFLDAHADIDARLRSNPSLLTNAEFLEGHPQLEAFLNQHPRVQTEVKENPSFFMQREKRFEALKNRRATNPNRDLTRQEVAGMDQFLDKNPNIEEDLRGNPSLVNDSEYLEAHPQLQAYLDQHQNVKEEIAENPRSFMQRENRFDAQEPGRRTSNPNPDLTRQQVAAFDQFLDSHPDVDKTLRSNPRLVRDATYLREHPELQTFLDQHPELKEESAETPKYLMGREKQFDAREPSRRDRDRDSNRDRAANARRDHDADRDLDANQDRDADRDRAANGATQDRDLDRRPRSNPTSNSNADLSSQEVASMDQFLDRHPDVAKSLEKKPELVNDRGYLKHHKDLEEFFSEHPAVQQEVQENPSYFMSRENRLEARNLDRDMPARNRDRARDTESSRRSRDVDSDLNKKELQDMDHFLDKHKKIEKDLQRNPTLVNDQDYLRHHKPLETFLSKNPQVGEELRENPSAFMRNQERLEQRNHHMNNPQTAKPKTKTEEKEEMHSTKPH